MRKIFFVLLILLLCSNVYIYAQNVKGNSSVGFFLGGAFSDNSNAAIGVDYRYSITDNIRLAPSVSYYLERSNSSAWNIDINGHYVIPLADKFSFYPLAGINWSFWDIYDYNNKSKLGVNIGLGGEYYATSKIVVGLDVKYNTVKKVEHVLAAVRVGYMF